MKSFFMGLVVGVLGLIVWLVASVIEGLVRGVEGKGSWVYSLVVLGFLLMIGGPVFFWLLRPLWNKVRRQRV